MTIKNMIQDGEGSKRTAGVTTDHSLKVTNVDLSVYDLYVSGQLDILTRTKIYSSYLKNSSDSESMNVDGSTTPVEFYIQASASKLISVTNVRFVLNSTQMALSSSEGRRFAAAAASPGLTNGIEFYVEQGGVVTDIFSSPVKQIASFLNYSDDFYNEAGALGSGMDILITRFDFSSPINIVPGVIDRIVVKISDDLTAIDLFNVAAIGTQQLIPELEE
jgi:hypothetical protein